MNASQGVQCRTMTSQRPCGARDCTRKECSGKAPNMCDSCGVSQGSREWCEYCGLDTTPPREPLYAPESDERTTEVQEPTYSLTGLTERHVRALASILARTTAQTSAEVEARVIIGATLDKINK